MLKKIFLTAGVVSSLFFLTVSAVMGFNGNLFFILLAVFIICISGGMAIYVFWMYS